jgi:pyruvate dehydrogenase E2 component (dihydrolipoamide acetyltransferase)
VADFTLPELGEQIESGDVLQVLVKPGDTITKDQAVLELETDKATIEVPSSVAGVVKEIKVKSGDKVKVGQVILSVEDQGAPKQAAAAKSAPAKGGGEGGKSETAPKQATAKAEPAKAAEAAPKKGAAKAADADEVAPKPGAAKAGAAEADEVPDMQPDVEAKDQSDKPDKAGVKDPSVGPQEEDEDEAAPSPAPARNGGERAAPQDDSRGKNVVDISRGARAAADTPEPSPELPPAPAAPSVRRMARELGVDVNEVPGSGPAGRISIDDVKAHTKRLVAGGAGSGASARGVALPDFTRWGSVERQPMRAVRRKTAEHLSAAWASIPHVTQCDLADITSLEEMRKKYAKQVEAAGGSLTVTAIAVKVVAAALKVFPQFNASIDMAADEIVLKKYVNVGIAVDTDRGLLVPVIRDADRKNIVQLSVELAQLSEKARTRKISLEEMQGGCFSISNLGGIGGTYFTPIVNAPEVAILGISRARMEPVYQKESGQFVPRFMLPLSLSYDHRVIDGADAIRFLRWVAEALEQPFLLSLQG